MPSYLCFSVTFLDPAFHGCGEGGKPEWPPSPLRLFQALVAAAAARWRGTQFADYAAPALRWLEAQSPPLIVAPRSHTGVPVRTAVPNNDLDIVAADWARRREPRKQPAALKTMKTVRPTRLTDGDAVHYLWELSGEAVGEFEQHKETLLAATRSVVALGWGIDMVAANGRLLDQQAADRLPGERWRPTADPGAAGLRTPAVGTLEALAGRHTAFLNRLSGDGFKPVPPLTAFAVVGYRRATDPPGREFVAFELRSPDFDRYRPFDPVTRTRDVAGMVRHALAQLAKNMRPFGWTDEHINTFVHGHNADGTDRARGADADRRFAYLPLPSLEARGGGARHAGMIRRVLVVGPPGHADAVRWARVLSGQDLVRDGDPAPVAALRLIDRPAAALRTDPNLGPYVGESRTWSTVTPMVMPGHEDQNGLRERLDKVRDPEAKKRLLDRLERRAEKLLRRAFVQSGLPRELVDSATLEWRAAGFRPGVDLARRYRLPESSRPMPTYHVRVRFPTAVRGPLAVGAGRYRGFGLFAVDRSE